jgi:hypothetical protein
MRLIPQKEKLKTKQARQEKKSPRMKKRRQKNLRRNLMSIGIEIPRVGVALSNSNAYQ